MVLPGSIYVQDKQRFDILVLSQSTIANHFEPQPTRSPECVCQGKTQQKKKRSCNTFEFLLRDIYLPKAIEKNRTNIRGRELEICVVVHYQTKRKSWKNLHNDDVVRRRLLPPTFLDVATWTFLSQKVSEPIQAESRKQKQKQTRGWGSDLHVLSQVVRSWKVLETSMTFEWFFTGM